MKYSHIQRIVIVYGTKDRIKTFLESNVQAIEEDREEKINLREIKNNIKLANKLISFCINHFNDYKPKIKI